MKININTAVIFCGGKGTRINTNRNIKILKPLIKINRKPLISYIIDIYKKNNIKNIYLLGGYKVDDLKSYIKESSYKNIRVINTGINTGTAGRLLKIKKYIKNDYFYLTYGDTYADFNSKYSLKYINKNPDHLIMSSFKYAVPYGVLYQEKSILKNIIEKKYFVKINAGFYTLNSTIFKYIRDLSESFEIDTLPKIIKDGVNIKEIPITKWYPVDNTYDKNIIEGFLNKNK